MAIEKRFIHFKKFSDFNSKKLSANEANTQYTIGISGEIQNGSPDVLYQSYVWIKDTQQQWTHGQIYNGSASLINETDPIFSASPAANITENQIIKWDDTHEFIQDFNEDISKLYDDLSGKQDIISDLETIRSNAAKGSTAVQPSSLAAVATSGSYNDLVNKPTIPSAVTESTVSGWGFTKNTGTITGVSANGTSVATSGVANIPAATTSKYGVTKLSSATNSTSTSLAATASAVKSAYDLANGRQEKLVSGTNIKTINNTSILGSGNIAIDANIQAVDTQETIDSVDGFKTINGESIIGSGDITISTNSSKNYIEWNESDMTFSGGDHVIPNMKYVCTTPLIHLNFVEMFDPEDCWHGGVTDLYNEYTIIFISNECEFSLPDYIQWANGSMPTLEANIWYELSISLMYINNTYIGNAVLVPFKSV